MCIPRSNSRSRGIELHFFPSPCCCWFVTNINMQACREVAAEQAAAHLHMLDSIWTTLAQPYLAHPQPPLCRINRSYFVRFRTQPLCWVIYSTFSTWLLSKQSNSTTNPLIFTSLQRDLRGREPQQCVNGKFLSCSHWYRDVSLLDDCYSLTTTQLEPWFCTRKRTRKP